MTNVTNQRKRWARRARRAGHQGVEWLGGVLYHRVSDPESGDGTTKLVRLKEIGDDVVPELPKEGKKADGLKAARPEGKRLRHHVHNQQEPCRNCGQHVGHTHWCRNNRRRSYC